MKNSLIKSILIFSIKIYTNFISILLPDTCRFTPTCSNYALESIKKYNIVNAMRLTIKRICKCHPFHNKTGYDPVP